MKVYLQSVTATALHCGLAALVAGALNLLSDAEFSGAFIWALTLVVFTNIYSARLDLKEAEL